MYGTRQGLLAGVCLLGTLLSGVARAGEFAITEAETRRGENVVLLDARMRLDFDDEVREALDNGVPITVLVELQLERQRDYMWDDEVASLEQRYSLQYHALSQQYIVRNLNSNAQTAHRSLVAARNYLGTITDLPVIDTRLLQQGEPYILRLRAGIDINALPSPLRPVAWLSSHWRQQSDWLTCKVNY